ncbi:MAG: hypothetical protein K5798_03940 [Nitrosopumilus sp.]|uniref:hypothetical protein n=1 Tax=Nitrosopumilus sp. TaxID=2024843 RepID=UPI00242DD790|nr:hypothetical protein [Nitrosopumilus sp.]MCV0366404.1 hypothetical protein [Nitrosopumilus sp.]
MSDNLKNTVPDIAERISQLYLAMMKTHTDDEIATTINDILLLKYKISISLLQSSWDHFAKQKGVLL